MKFSLIVAASSFALLSSVVQASDFDFGVGIGPQYSGLGVSSKYFTSDSSALGVSAGCVTLSDFGSDSCGLGVSYERSDLFSTNTNQHSVGVYLGIVGDETMLRNGVYEQESVYGGGLFYTYYFNELRRPGFHIGTHVLAGKEESGTDVNFGLNLGYRF